MTDLSAFKPKTVYVIYVASTPGTVWQALTDPVEPCLKSMLETGKPLSVKMLPPNEMLEALRSLKLP